MALSPEGLRKSVANHYGERVRPVLDSVELEVPMAAAASCCGSESSASCCGPENETHASTCCGDAPSETIDRIAALYEESDLAGLPESVTSVAFGCGNPTAIDALRPGETVLDLGSGGGIDCFLAAKMVGPTGRVIGVDMTPEMIALANRNLARVGATNIEFRHGQIEELPIDSESVDVIISNCVINLSTDKDSVFREAFRVLAPGGRFQVSDIVWTREPDDAMKSDAEAWAGCIAGALGEQDFLERLRAAGFTEVRSVAAGYSGRQGIASAQITAVKP